MGTSTTGSAIKNSRLFSQTPEQIRDDIIKQGHSTIEAVACIVGNKTESVQAVTEGAVQLSKGGVSMHSGKKVGESAFKGYTD
jgi:hypothetical protein